MVSKSKHNNITTNDAAIVMLNSGHFYTAEKLSEESNLSKQRGASIFKNIEATAKYHTEKKGKKGHQVMRIVSIEGNDKVNPSFNDLWKMALF